MKLHANSGKLNGQNCRDLLSNNREFSDMTAYEMHAMARSRVVGRAVKQHVPVKTTSDYGTESGLLGENCSISKHLVSNRR